MTVPTPHFAVFYNGDEEQPERYEQRLSELFAKPVEVPELELTCTVYNINNGKNKELLSKCPFLRDYMTFVTYVRENHRLYGYEDLEHAIEKAIDRCIDEDVLREFLMTHRSEVIKVMTLDYTFDRQLKLEREDSRAEGWAEGRAEGREEGREEGRAEGRIREQIHALCEKLKKQKSFEQIAREMEMPKEEVTVIYDIACRFAPEYDEEQIYEAFCVSV